MLTSSSHIFDTIQSEHYFHSVNHDVLAFCNHLSYKVVSFWRSAPARGGFAEHTHAHGRIEEVDPCTN